MSDQLRASLVNYSNLKTPGLYPLLLDLFKENFHFTESEIIDVILKTQLLKGTDSRKLAILGFLKGQEAEIPKDFTDNLAARGLQASFAALNCSLKIENVHLLNEKTRTFSAGFFNDFQLPISINMYVTPSPEAPCFKPHCDLTEVFIFQLLGTKEWTFFCGEQGEYLSGQDDKSVLSPEKLNQCTKNKMLVKSDDILHIPPLMFHEACSTQGASVHLTISMNRLRVEHVLRVLESALMEDLDVKKYSNLSNEEFELVFAQALKKLDSEHFKELLKVKKEQMIFLSRSQILLKGR
jgi:hypothetical protein